MEADLPDGVGGKPASKRGQESGELQDFEVTHPPVGEVTHPPVGNEKGSAGARPAGPIVWSLRIAQKPPSDQARLVHADDPLWIGDMVRMECSKFRCGRSGAVSRRVSAGMAPPRLALGQRPG
jgi:hypothetical protein